MDVEGQNNSEIYRAALDPSLIISSEVRPVTVRKGGGNKRKILQEGQRLLPIENRDFYRLANTLHLGRIFKRLA